jgi:hypothetical protein
MSSIGLRCLGAGLNPGILGFDCLRLVCGDDGGLFMVFLLIQVETLRELRDGEVL